ncbi:MAG: selenide, water dikinase SelD, partial [Armatimonadota bacterium]|nr:selenide, water dikinase SelD [Armatimonadota bacterium]
FDTTDDAAVYRLTPDIAIINTLDFITPILDDPWLFGKVAAANSLSDVYAMGGRPVTALSIACFPVGTLDFGILGEILQGACETVIEAGALLAGGHTVVDPQLKFGLSVTGTVHPDQVLTNAGAQPGDVLILTKKLGTGIVTTGIKRGQTGPVAIEAVTHSMITLNASASEAAQRAGAHACTDITGFGFLGHLHQLARASGLAVRVDASALPILPEALELARVGVVPGGADRNRLYITNHVEWNSTPGEIQSILLDPQTSGGLLIAVEPHRADALVWDLEESGTLAAAVVGECVEGAAGRMEVG